MSLKTNIGSFKIGEVEAILYKLTKSQSVIPEPEFPILISFGIDNAEIHSVFSNSEYMPYTENEMPSKVKNFLSDKEEFNEKLKGLVIKTREGFSFVSCNEYKKNKKKFEVIAMIGVKAFMAESFFTEELNNKQIKTILDSIFIYVANINNFLKENIYQLELIKDEESFLTRVLLSDKETACCKFVEVIKKHSFLSGFTNKEHEKFISEIRKFGTGQNTLNISEIDKDSNCNKRCENLMCN